MYIQLFAVTHGCGCPYIPPPPTPYLTTTTITTTTTQVAFPLLLDVYDFCTPDLKTALAGPREAFKHSEDIKAGTAKKQKTTTTTTTSDAPDTAGNSTGPAGGDTDMADAPPADPDTLLRQHAGQRTGRYELHAVLTHKGRSADSGHYVAWVKQDDGTWIQFDDDTLIIRKADEVQTLAGGGDWHMAYMLLYREQTVPRVGEAGGAPAVVDGGAAAAGGAATNGGCS